MKNIWMNKAALATGTAALLTAMMGSAHAEPTGYDQLTFQTEVKEEIQNDEVRASMYKKAQATDAKTLATMLNTSINNAMKIAKRYPSVTVSTGQQRTYPRYDKKTEELSFYGANKNYSLTPKDRIKIELNFSNRRNRKYYKKYMV